MTLSQLKCNAVFLVFLATVDRASSSTVESHRLTARIIGSLHSVLTARELELQFLVQPMRLCDDADPSAHAMIAQSLATVELKLPLRVSENNYGLDFMLSWKTETSASDQLR